MRGNPFKSGALYTLVSMPRSVRLTRPSINPRRQRGILLVAAVVMIIVASLLATVVSFLYTASRNYLVSKQAYYIAESGLGRALYGLESEGTAGNALTYTGTVGRRSFSTTATRYNPAPSALSAAINATDTVIPLVTALGYAPMDG